MGHNFSTAQAVGMLLWVFLACAWQGEAAEYVVVSTTSTRDVMMAAFPNEREEYEGREGGNDEFNGKRRRSLRGNANNQRRIISGDDIAVSTTTAAANNATRTSGESGVDRAAVLDEQIQPVAIKVMGLVHLSAEDAVLLASTPGVVHLVLNSEVRLADSSPVEQFTPTTLWNKDRVDSPFGFDGMYDFFETGANVDAFVVDTGVYGAHTEFNGRVEAGTNFVDSTPADEDCNSHGTHVASTIGGKTYGLASGVSIVPVKVMDCTGRGTIYGLVSGITWVRDEYLRRKKTNPSRRAVINMSVSSSATQVIDDAVQSAYENGVIVVVAAGNSAANACSYSPARAPNAITVGGTSSDDSLLSISNTGPCVDIYAPGDNILGANPASPTATAVKFGTSMATPHVVGVVATLLEKYPNQTPNQIFQSLMTMTVALNAVMDQDCNGFAPAGARLLQTTSSYVTRPRSPPLALNFPGPLSVDGSVLNQEFSRWLPELTFRENQDICVTFNVRVAEARGGAKAALASIRLALSTHDVPMGFSQFLNTPATCRSNDVNYYVFESGPLQGSMWGKSYQFLDKNAWGSGNSPAPLSSTISTQFYVSASKNIQNGGLDLEFGTGDGLGKESTPLVSYTDPSGLRTLQNLGFTAPNAFTLEITSIRTCGASVGSGSGAGSGVDDGGDGASSTPAPTAPDTINLAQYAAVCKRYRKAKKKCNSNAMFGCSFKKKKGGCVFNKKKIRVA